MRSFEAPAPTGSTITTANGSDASAVTGDFEIDTKYPSLVAEVPYSFFSPDSDGVKDNLPVTIKDATNEKKWTAEVRNAKDKVVKSFVWSGKSNSFVWDGSNESGNFADNGKYSIVVYSTDDAGNSFNTEIKDIVMDNRETKVYLTAEYEGISPNNDKVLDEQKFTIKATVQEDLASWKFSIKREDGTVVYTISDAEMKNLPGQITWHGNDAKTKKVVEGTFFALPIAPTFGNHNTSSKYCLIRSTH